MLANGEHNSLRSMVALLDKGTRFYIDFSHPYTALVIPSVPDLVCPAVIQPKLNLSNFAVLLQEKFELHLRP